MQPRDGSQQHQSISSPPKDPYPQEAGFHSSQPEESSIPHLENPNPAANEDKEFDELFTYPPQNRVEEPTRKRVKQSVPHHKGPYAYKPLPGSKKGEIEHPQCRSSRLHNVMQKGFNPAVHIILDEDGGAHTLKPFSVYSLRQS